MSSPRLGFYVISIGIILQVFGLAGGSWMNDSAASGDVSFGGPSYALLVLGMAVVVAGTVLGSLSLSNSLTPTNGDTPRLLPLTPLVLLAAVSIGSGAFAFQASNTVSSSGDGGDGGAPLAPLVAATPDPQDCIEGLIWHDVMGHCMTQEAIDALENGTAVCPERYSWQQETQTCVSLASPDAPEVTVPTCPAGYYWHPAMVHCMALTVTAPSEPIVCEEGYFWHPQMGHCMAITVGPAPEPGATPVCPSGTYWHPVMDHCMPDEGVCPVGYDYNPATGYCAPPPTEPPAATPTPPPGATPPPPPSETPAPGDSPTPSPTPECPAGYFWHPAMGHCMSETCPPPLVLNPDTLYCELPPEPGPTATETPTPEPPAATPTPECPAGYFWHPAMGHCMSETCPPPLVLNPDTLYCELPATAGRSSGS